MNLELFPCTVTTRDTTPPPGHHPESGSILSMPNAVILSELAATILQGFPEDWCFSGKTKKARWSQLGQAMPPPLAEAVARAVVEQMRATREAAA
jgi:site-specific DNA-cytosine methylase